jgi:xanthine dehydrogenase molybdopterin-binding subunit B
MSKRSTHAQHESAHLHVQGLAAYIDDLPLTEGTLACCADFEQVARGRICRWT